MSTYVPTVVSYLARWRGRAFQNSRSFLLITIARRLEIG